MKSKNKKSITPAQRVIVIITLIMMIVNSIVMNIISTLTEKTLIDTEHKYLTEIVRNISNTAQQTVHEYVSICDILSQKSSIIEVLRDSDRENHMEYHPRVLEAVEEMTIVFDSYDGKIMSMAIFDVEQDSYLLNTGGVSGDDFSFRTRPYYSPVETQEFVITLPYLDVLTNGLVVTIACPVIDNGEVLGVVGLDLPIDFMSHLVMESTYGDSGRSLVLDSNNTILAYSDPSFINSHYELLGISGEELFRELESPTGDLFQYDMLGETRMGIITQVEDLDWKILTAMNYAEFDQISSIIILLLVLSGFFTLVICSTIISGKFSEALLQSHSTDPLTGFPNRMGFSSEVNDLKENPPNTMGVISVNINGLKHINENSGIHEGDKYIKNSAECLKHHFQYHFFRMSGDELVALAPNVEKVSFEEKVEQLHRAMRDAENYDFSFGHAWDSGRYDIWHLLQEADNVMFINKQDYYSSEHRKSIYVNDSLLSDLLSSLADEEFMVYLQPQVHLKDGSLYGAEALIRRFDKKNQKMIFPDQFISLYEKRSVIRHVDLFVVDKVCQLLQEWNNLGKGIPISVNLSRVTLQEFGIVDTIVAICDKYELPHHLLVIEVTERVGLIENNVPSALISNFQKEGFHISLDDFGCAYSNIVTLAQIEVDEVKLDKSLIDHLLTNEKNAVIVQNVLSMCNGLAGTTTLAEGIEYEEQANTLAGYGCKLGQGYFYSRPIPTKEFYEKYIQKED